MNSGSVADSGLRYFQTDITSQVAARVDSNHPAAAEPMRSSAPRPRGAHRSTAVVVSKAQSRARLTRAASTIATSITAGMNMYSTAPAGCRTIAAIAHHVNWPANHSAHIPRLSVALFGGGKRISRLNAYGPKPAIIPNRTPVAGSEKTLDATNLAAEKEMIIHKALLALLMKETGRRLATVSWFSVT